jgi:hypothetical protein
MSQASYPGIRFPDRAEALGEFAGYKIFLDPWEPLAEDLRKFYEGLAVRRESRVLAIHGSQGTGKTLFATKLRDDFVRSKDAGAQELRDPNNLWHRVTGGPDLSSELIAVATASSDLLLVEDQAAWVESTAEWLKHRSDRRCVVIADNAERPYFRQGLVDVSDADFIRLQGDPKLTELAAQRLVAHCRSDFRGALFVVLSNDDVFLLALDEAVEGQHAGLLTLTQLPVADARTKETVVRVNTNRLNRLSYWYCLDKARPDEKSAVKRALEGASNFPDSFQAVDTAIRTAPPGRIGRPARQNVITLVALTELETTSNCDPTPYGELQRTEVAHEWCSIHVFGKAWAPPELGLREASLLESEWVLRLAILGAPLARSLIEIAESRPSRAAHEAACRGLFEDLRTFHGPGAHEDTRSLFRRAFEKAVDCWPVSTADLEQFWAQGLTRSRVYESALSTVLPGYNTAAEGFLTYRPDLVVAPFRPCSIVAAIADDPAAINAAIRRDAHVFEFTATNAYTPATIRSYMAEKFSNYVQVMQEQ